MSDDRKYRQRGYQDSGGQRKGPQTGPKPSFPKPPADRIEPQECLVIEDSIHGVSAAHSAEMRCLAITNSYPKEKLFEAELVIDSLVGLSLKDIEHLFVE